MFDESFESQLIKFLLRFSVFHIFCFFFSFILYIIYYYVSIDAHIQTQEITNVIIIIILTKGNLTRINDETRCGW